jgi:catechol 2,3-dioxygenase-like lactoylglutathione lyase family enzyme
MATPSAPVESGSASRIAAATSLGTVSLTVNDLDRSRAFYERAIGMLASELDDGAVALGVAGDATEPPRSRAVPPGDPRADEA